MIVCSCRAVSDRDLRELARAGLSHADVVAQTGVGTDCGCCREDVADILSRAAGPCRGADACPGCPRRRAA
jgi:bacterioferritin-associated ferredoxin